MNQSNTESGSLASRTAMATLCTTVVVVLFGGLSACQKSLFPDNTPRTQFETHDRLRNRNVPLEKPDAFGRMNPALRERLSRRQ